jgi:predicted transcriptional regulator
MRRQLGPRQRQILLTLDTSGCGTAVDLAERIAAEYGGAFPSLRQSLRQLAELGLVERRHYREEPRQPVIWYITPTGCAEADQFGL